MKRDIAIVLGSLILVMGLTIPTIHHMVIDDTRHDPLVLAIIEVESGGRLHAKGSKGELGVLQIRPIMVREANRILGKEQYQLEDRLSLDKSIEMFHVYSDYWCSKTGDYSEEGIARRWNGGPKGHRKQATEGYWQKVKEAMPHDGGSWQVVTSG